MFTDIRNFSTLSENISPEELTEHLSEYLGLMSDIILKYNGTIDKYMGDGILAFWGAPKDQENSPELACKAAIDCQKALSIANKKWIRNNRPEMFTRVGIHTGDVVVGNIGTDRKLEYSIIGDAVNVASRIEGVNKKFATKILISEDTQDEVKNIFSTRYITDTKVKGRDKTVKLYELIK